MAPGIESTRAWSRLQAHFETVRHAHMRDLFAADPERFERFHAHAAGLLLDYSKNRIVPGTLPLLCALARETGTPALIDAMFAGERVNSTEDRAAMHAALRHRGSGPFPSPQRDVMPEVRETLARLRRFSEAVRSGAWRGFSDRPVSAVVNIGIGGSDLGPLMAVHALGPRCTGGPRVHFVSNVDAGALCRTLGEVDLESTLFIVASKTFGTQETLLNATSARRRVVERFGTEAAVAKHFVAVSTQADRVRDFGIDAANMFGFWDWVGGRYSLWSAIGLPVMLAAGMDAFEEMQAGASEMDRHFRETDLAGNLPVILALLGVWYRNFFGAQSHAVLPYDFGLQHFPAYLQQLEMESNGKRVRRDGLEVDYDTVPVVWGGLGNNAQHAFFQMLHQGTTLVPCDLIVPARGQHRLEGHDEAVLANALGQAEALMRGRSAEEASAAPGSRPALARHRALPGNQPSSVLVYQSLTPRVLGALIALYEHKVLVQSGCWGINAFDQWGVELGKELAGRILPEIVGGSAEANHDASTRGLIEHLRTLRG